MKIEKKLLMAVTGRNAEVPVAAMEVEIPQGVMNRCRQLLEKEACQVSSSIDAENLASEILFGLIRRASGKALLKVIGFQILAGSLPTPLRQEVRSKAQRLLRKQRRIVPLTELTDKEVEVGSGLLAEPSDAETFVESLPEDCRIVVRLKQAELKQGEIAGILGIGPRAVRYREKKIRESAKKFGLLPEPT